MQAQSEEPSDPPLAEVRWHFGQFVLWETQRRLERNGQPVRLGPRSFDLLLHLVRRAGEFIGKDELLATVWADVVVEEGSVRVHMFTLRKALGEPGNNDECSEWITNVTLRGYRFNGRVRREEVDPSAGVAVRPYATSFAKLPVRLTGLVGRDADVEAVLGVLEGHRLVTITGTGGIGKTSVAIRAAECHQHRHATKVAFVDLSPLISQEHVLGTMVRSLGAAADLPDPVEAIAQRLAGEKVLLLVDNCEHVIDALVRPICLLLSATPELRVLATSREALRATGEAVYHLSPLAVPEGEPATLAQVTAWPAVRLLVERARSAGAGVFEDAQAPWLARIARQLDGIPLAIELVAARLGAQPVGDLAQRLDDHMRLSIGGNRAALPRHRSLAAALDWSIALLTEEELRIFRRLSVFRGHFDAESALSVAADTDPDATFDALISLVGKSLVQFEGNEAIAPYRLLDTTRSYAAALLSHSDERAALLRRHAMFMLDQMKAATTELSSLSEQSWGERYEFRLDDVRFALGVCLGDQIDARMAAALVTESGPLWFHVSEVEEYRGWISSAVALVDRQVQPDVETAAALNTVLVSVLLHTGAPNDALNVACDRALAGALAAGSRTLELRARWGCCTHDMFRGEYTAALQQSRTLLELAQSSSEAAVLSLSHRVSAMANHFCGKLDESRQHSATAIALSGNTRSTHTTLVGPDALVAAQALLCRTLWLRGEAAQASMIARQTVARAQSLGHSVSLCAALYGACAVALWSGELDLARQWVPMMSDEARRRGLLGWLRYVNWFALGLQLAVADDVDRHVREVRARLAGYDAPCKEMLMTFCADWLDDEVIERVSRGEGLWCAPEAWRALGWRREQHGAAEEAEELYRRALDIARQQGALGWELRAARSLATLLAGQGRQRQAAMVLDEVRARSGGVGDGMV